MNPGWRPRPCTTARVAPRAIWPTSGTTGRPKGVLRDAVPLTNSTTSSRACARGGRHIGVVPGRCALMSAPLHRQRAPGVFIQNALQMAERLVLTPRSTPNRCWRWSRNIDRRTYLAVPIMYVRLLKLPAEVRARYDLSSIRFVASTGRPCSPEAKEMIEWFGPVIHETYASSEAGTSPWPRSRIAVQRPGTAGWPVDAASVRILDEAGHARRWARPAWSTCASRPTRLHLPE